jgi:ABC-type Mn2+/Zn2+ transport system ATPase subunit
MVRLQNATVGYSGRPVLEDVTLTLSSNAFAALLGANGSGKTTLLKSIAGILPLLAGTVRLGTTQGHPPILGYVPQRERLDPIFLLNSLEVVLMGTCGRIPPGRPYPRSERDWAAVCLERTGADALARLRFAELSGGQKQRVLIARALATRANLLLLDEPTTGLDPAAKQTVLELLTQLHTDQGLTLMMVTHDVAAARHHATEAFLIHQARVHQGRPEQLLDPRRLEELFDLQLQ